MNRIVSKCCIVILGLTIISCAKIGHPNGGPKDVDPPVVLKTNPPENSINSISPKRIVIYFDEFIQLEDIYQEMILSPPLEEKITTQIRGKDLLVDFPKDVVFDTSTYTLGFGKGIVDNNEKNVLKDYTYIFSFKDYIDSMNVQGTILNSFDFKPDEERMHIMLYKNLNDSAPLLEKPSYIARTDDQGRFLLPNLEIGKYRIFALKDANGNMIYDLPTEQIAFADSVIEVSPERFEENVVIKDSILLANLLSNDSIHDPNKSIPDSLNSMDSDVPSTGILTQTNSLSDSLASDSIPNDSLEFVPDFYTYISELLFFTESSYQQYMTNYERPRAEKLVFTFNESPKDTIEIFPLNFTPSDSNWFLLDVSPENDTLNLWLTDSTHFGMDSIYVEVCYTMRDTMDLPYSHMDTLLLRAPVEEVVTSRSRGGLFRNDDEEEEIEIEKPELKVGTNITNSRQFALYKNVELILETPISSIIEDSIQFFVFQDTLQVAADFSIVQDSSSLYSVTLQYQPESETRYRIFAPDSIIYDIYGETNDTLDISFTTRSEDTYGILSLNLTGVDFPLVVQLLDDKENFLKERIVNENKRISFEYLDAGDYLIKVFIDANENGIWDTGNYLKHLQAEKVIFYPNIISVRTNWEVDLSWEVPK